MNPSVQGVVANGFEPVREAFEAAFQDAPNMGAALAIRHRGDVVVDLWGGVADERDRSPWRDDTVSVIFSSTKGLMSILAARLVQEGRLNYEAPVVDYWPEFAGGGKHAVQVKHLLSHQAGLSAPREPLTLDDILNWNTVAARLAAQKPLWTPGSGHQYHPLTYGWLIGEVIRRVTGVTVGQYFQELITGPLNVDSWIGLPPQNGGRVAHMQLSPAVREFVAKQPTSRNDEVPDWDHEASTLGGSLPRGLVTETGGFNDARVQAAEIPGAGGISSARALATIWAATIGSVDGVRLLDEEIIRQATQVQSAGHPVFPAPQPWPRWGMGFQLDSDARRYLTGAGFGHDGAGGQVAFADPVAEVGFAFLTNYMAGDVDVRGTAVVDALRAVLA